MKKFSMCCWVICCGLLLAALIGIPSCDRGGDNSSSGGIPVSPIIPSPGIDDEFAAFKGNEYFQVNVLPGEYLLTYRTNVRNYDAVLVFRATEIALLTIWLQPGEQVNDATLFKGTITSGNAIAFTGAVIYVIQPGSGIPWETVFVKADEFPILLISRGITVIRALPDPRLTRPTPTPTPQPVATATPQPGVPTATPTQPRDPTPTPQPSTPTPEVQPTATPTATPTPEPKPTATPTPEPEPTATPTPTPTTVSMLPDLTFSSISGPNGAYAGEEIDNEINFVIYNNGNGIAEGTLTSNSQGYMMDIVLSTDSYLPVRFAEFSESFHEDVLLRGGRCSRTQTLQPGETFSNCSDIGSVVIPSDTPEGQYCLGFVVDPGTVVDESNETNNTACHWIHVSIM